MQNLLIGATQEHELDPSHCGTRVVCSCSCETVSNREYVATQITQVFLPSTKQVGSNLEIKVISRNTSLIRQYQGTALKLTYGYKESSDHLD